MKPLANDRVHLDTAEARTLSERAFAALGYDESDAAILAEHVLDAALCGYEYSGLPKILNVAEHRRQRMPRTPMKPIRETPVSALLDGGNTCGMVTMYRASEVAIAKAGASGIAVVGLINSWVSGRSAHYVEKIARAGLVGLHTVSSTRHVAPLGGTKAAIGTNPIAFGFPTQDEPVVIDLGTSAFMSTDLQFRQRRGEQLPENVAIDAQGRPTRDPTAALAGALLPFGGYKGYALGFALHAMGVLAGSGFDFEKSYGYLIIAIRPDLLVPMEDFRRHMSELVAAVKATPRQPGVDEIRIPSERSFRERARRLVEGIEIDAHIHAALVKLAEGR